MDNDKTNRKSISLNDKYNIIEDMKTMKQSEICSKYSIPKSTVSNIKKSKNKIVNAYENGLPKNHKKIRPPENPGLDNTLGLWFKQSRALGIPVSGALIKEKAKLIAEKMSIDTTCSDGYVRKFKDRMGIKYRKICGEALGVDMDIVKEWMNNELPVIESKYKPKDIFNCDETGLFYRCMPGYTMTIEANSESFIKSQKMRLTIMVGANADGSEKLPLLAIGKYANPRCFKNVKELPVDYVNNK